jgi:hypothetical protein
VARTKRRAEAMRIGDLGEKMRENKLEGIRK